MHEYMELTFLGTGGSWPTTQRNVSAIALKRGSEVLLFDCGEGTQRQFQRSGVSYMAVSKMFITHLHGDHVLGMPGILQTMELNERREPLEIYGPPGIARFVKVIQSPPYPRTSYPLHVHELKDRDTIPFDGYHVDARILTHTIPNLGYAVVEEPRPGRFDKPRALELGVREGPAFGRLQRGESVPGANGPTVTPEMVLGPARRGRKVVVTGDCVPCEATVELARRADVLVHEATFMSDAPQANEFGHSTAQQAAFMASKAEVGILYLTHISPRYRDATALEQEAQAVFKGAVLAHDLMTEIIKFPADEPAGAEAPAPSEPVGLANGPTGG